MPFYQVNDPSSEELTVDLGNEQSITFYLRKETVVSVGDTLILDARKQQVDLIEQRVKQLDEDLRSGNLDQGEFDKKLKEITDLRSRDTLVALMQDMLYRACSGWKDYYKDREAEARGEVLEYTPENIKTLKAGPLTIILQALFKHYGVGLDEGKESSESLDAGSQTPASPQSDISLPSSTNFML